MSKYGQIINDVSEDILLYKCFVEYFNNPMMTKIDSKEGKSIYGVKVKGNNIDNKFIIVFVNEDNLNMGKKKNLSDLYWDSFQTRTLTTAYDVETHSYEVRKYKELLNPIHRREINDKNCSYTCEGLPLRIVLLNYKNQYHNYKERGTLLSAIETYNTIIIRK